MKAPRLFFVLPVAALIAALGCSSHKSEAQPPEVIKDVATQTVTLTKLPQEFVAPGTVQSVETAQLAPQVMGTIISISVREGDRVRRGQVLATIDGTQPRATLQRAQASLLAAQHESAAAESARSLAETTLRRYETLYQRKSVSPQEYDEVKARYQGAIAKTEAARAGQSQAKAAVSEASTALGYASIRAPFDGVVVARRADPGALAVPGMPLLTVEATGNHRLEVEVDENNIAFVTSGQPVNVVLDALPGVAIPGKVQQIVPAADPASRSFTVKIALPQNSVLRSGLYGRATFSHGERNALIVAQSSLVERGALKGVYVVGPDKLATLRYITTGASAGNAIEVLSGLSANETVVASPSDRELAGKRIEVRQ